MHIAVVYNDAEGTRKMLLKKNRKSTCNKTSDINALRHVLLDCFLKPVFFQTKKEIRS